MKQKKYTTSAQEEYLGIIPYSIQYSEWLEKYRRTLQIEN